MAARARRGGGRGDRRAARARGPGRSTARWTPSTASARGGLGGVGADGGALAGRAARALPDRVVRVVQQDAIDRLGLHRLLLEPEVLENVTPDVHLAATLMSLRDALPEASRTVARRVVRAGGRGHRAPARRPHARAARGALDRSARTSRPRPAEIDWDRTIRANLQPLPARAQDRDPRAARRPRAQAPLARRRADPRARPERVHGRLGRPRRRARRVAGLAARR